MGLEDLIVRLRIEENNCMTEIKTGKIKMKAKTNLVESNFSMGKKRKRKEDNQKGKAKKPKKFSGNYYNCEKSRHWAKDCQQTNQDKHNQANMSEKFVPMDLSELNFSIVMFMANLIDNPIEWRIDIGVTHHICSDKSMFSTYTSINGRKLFIGNKVTSDIVGLGKVVLKLALVSSSLLVKSGFKFEFHSDKFAMTNNDQFVDKGYVEKDCSNLM
ncbi:RNA-directed DNA polymerase [Handroanthus impetiginosus]|uniref:RNA-directed DNA polymerase n=1 Tax=Handroanthus impetiginosus TaxID=429701 RepID=A0A2G9HJ88_9LAMI|nr:RNA-directed DNA polymerase [Handroanthus impetiginosus]